MIKAGTLRGYFVIIKNPIFKGVEPLSLSFCVRKFRELERKEKGELEALEDLHHHHHSSVWSINSFLRYVFSFMFN